MSPENESDSSLEYDIDVVEEQIRDADDAKRASRLRRAAALWTGALVTTLVLAALLVNHLVPSVAPDEWNVWLIASATLIVLGSWIGIIVYIIRKRQAEYKLERKIIRCRDARRHLLTRMQDAEDLTVLRQYHSSVLNVIDEYRAKSARYRRTHNIYQSIVIIGSIVTTSVTSAASQFAFLRWVSPVIAMAVGISAGMTGYFKHKERSMNLQQAADAIEHEHTAVELGIEAYVRETDAERRKSLALFAEKVERLKDEQRKREQQLEQPPEAQRQQ